MDCISKNMPFSRNKGETTMRQGNGSDLPGVNSLRSADIGIIYVAPNDDRQSVLAAILTQDRLGRKQVAVVLPEQTKAFQRPVDFDGLKSMRRGLKAQIVFIAPAGPGPADFARQRRFPVYSSLESYARSLQDADQANESTKKGWLSLPWQKPAAAPPSPLPDPARPESIQPAPVTLSNQASTEDNDTRNAVAASAAGAATVMGIDALASQGNSPSTSFNDWDDLPPADHAEPAAGSSLLEDAPTLPANTVSPPVSSTGAENEPEPKIIEFSSQRSRITGKLPLPAIMPVAAAQPNVPSAPVGTATRQGNSGKIAAVGAASTIAGVTGLSRTTRVGGPPPTLPRVGGGTGGGGPLRPILLGALVLLVLAALVVGGIAYTAPGALGPLKSLLPGAAPSATVTITPASNDVSNTYVIFGVTGTPDPSQRQVQARQLSSASSTQSKTVNATGVGQTPGAQAKGTLTFFNGSTSSETVAAGTAFKGKDGVFIVNDVPAVIPGAHPPTEGSVTVAAHAANAGVSGNIKASDINTTCCFAGNFVSVQNTAPFTGGQNPQTFTVVQQSDIDGAARPLENTLMPEAQRSLQGQVNPSEQPVSPPQCASTVTSDHKAGDRAANVTVTVKVSCSGEVYDKDAAQTIAADLLKQQATQTPGSGYALVGNLVTTVKHVMVTDPNTGTLSLTVRAEGIWVFQFSNAQKQALANLIAGKSKQDAQALLLKQMGVAKADITISGGNGNTLPTDPSAITIVVQSVPGVQGLTTPTTGPASPPVPTSTPVPPIPTSTSSVGKG
jgi:hypothetical protein